MSYETAQQVDRLVEPDVVLPSQFFGTIRRQALAKRGECQLLIAVLEDAVHCFQKYLLARDKPGQRLFREAEEWITTQASEPRDAPTLSFEYVCDMVGVDSLYLRGGLQRWRERQLAARGENRPEAYGNAAMPEGPAGHVLAMRRQRLPRDHRKRAKVRAVICPIPHEGGMAGNVRYSGVR